MPYPHKSSRKESDKTRSPIQVELRSGHEKEPERVSFYTRKGREKARLNNEKRRRYGHGRWPAILSVPLRREKAIRSNAIAAKPFSAFASIRTLSPCDYIIHSVSVQYLQAISVSSAELLICAMEVKLIFGHKTSGTRSIISGCMNQSLKDGFSGRGAKPMWVVGSPLSARLNVKVITSTVRSSFSFPFHPPFLLLLLVAVRSPHRLVAIERSISTCRLSSNATRATPSSPAFSFS